MQNDRPQAVAIIPARGGSKRVPKKNVALVAGKPLIGWAIQAALGSKSIGAGRVFVSTDDSEIAEIARSFDAIVVDRPSELGTDSAWTEPVIQHAVSAIEVTGIAIELVAWMNACVPQLQSTDIDMAVTMLHQNRLREVIAVSMDGLSNSAVRVLTREALFQRRLSVRFGVLKLPYVDINTTDDLTAVQALLDQGNAD